MTVFNATHLFWEQVMSDDGQPAELNGKVIDTMWLVQDNHGPFSGF